MAQHYVVDSVDIPNYTGLVQEGCGVGISIRPKERWTMRHFEIDILNTTNDPALTEPVMARLLEQALPVSFRVSTSDEERVAAYKLRYEAVVARGWASPGDFPGGLEHDAYDERALQITGWHGNTLVVTGRLAFPQPDMLLPTEKAFDLVVEPRGRFADAGRSVVVQAYSDMGHRLLLALHARCWYEIHARGLSDNLVGNLSPVMIRLYRRLGFPLTVLGDARYYWGEERLPILVDMAGASRALAQRWGWPA